MPQLQIFLAKDNRINFDLGEERVTIGRLANNSLQIDELSVSGHHADIFLKAGRYHLHDPGSTNGTFVNGEQVKDAVLRSGDEVRFGSVEGVFVSEEEAAASLNRDPIFLQLPLRSRRQARVRRISSAPRRHQKTSQCGTPLLRRFTAWPLLLSCRLEQRCFS